MTEELRLAGYREPLGLRVIPESRLPEHPTLRRQGLEFSSRGDRVPGRIWTPDREGGPLPLVLVLPGDSAAQGLEALASRWAESGAAVASIHLPLEGPRSDAKLAAFLPDERDAAPVRQALAQERARQAVVDLERSLDALCQLEWIDAARIAYVGFGDGARVGAAFCALDGRVGATVLGPEAVESGASPLDPARYAARIPPRPLRVLEDPGSVWSEAETAETWKFLSQTLSL